MTVTCPIFALKMKYYLNPAGRPIYFHELGEQLYGSFFIFTLQGRAGIQSERFEIIIPPIYEAIKPAFGLHFWGKLQKRWRLYSFENLPVGAHSFRRVKPFNLEYAAVSIDGKLWGFTDRLGNMVIPPNYLSGDYLGLDYFAVAVLKKDRHFFGVTDRSGNSIIPFKLESKPTFSETIHYLLKKRKPLREWLKL